MTTLFSAVQGSTSAGMWLGVLFLGEVVLVTVISLLRAERSDVPRVFGLFALAFGFRKLDRTLDNGPGKIECRTQDDVSEAGA